MKLGQKPSPQLLAVIFLCNSCTPVHMKGYYVCIMHIVGYMPFVPAEEDVGNRGGMTWRIEKFMLGFHNFRGPYQEDKSRCP